jgi:hypothetical protein
VCNVGERDRLQCTHRGVAATTANVKHQQRVESMASLPRAAEALCTNPTSKIRNDIFPFKRALKRLKVILAASVTKSFHLKL